jgi:ribonucleoside-diphosphate reductase alpha chain
LINKFGPTLAISEEVHADKYRTSGESFEGAMGRIAKALGDSESHTAAFLDILLNQRFMPAGRIQSAMGAERVVTPYNCFVSGTILDDSNDIMVKAKEAFQTMRLGGGIGYDFSTLRPRNAIIKSLDSKSSGPVTFMGIYDSTCKTVSSAGHRRGAQMGVLRIDHPDIEEFIDAKLPQAKMKPVWDMVAAMSNDDPQKAVLHQALQTTLPLQNFNISVGVTDEFMDHLRDGTPFPLRFKGEVYKYVDPQYLWDKLMKATWDWAEPGVLFIDRMNWKNNLYYCETIAATNPCAEQPLPPYGACLLGSFNLVKYIVEIKGKRFFEAGRFVDDIKVVVRAMDNVVDRATYPLDRQREEATSKRRMGIGVTGLANAIESLGYSYGSSKFLSRMEHIFALLRDTCYLASVDLAEEKGPFPLFDKDKYLASNFIQTLPAIIRERIARHGIRNSHLLSIAPTGTISLSADNISSGIEPVFSYGYDRTIIGPNGPTVERVDDYGIRVFGVRGKPADLVTIDEHVAVLNLASKYVDSACSKTCNVGDNVTFEEFKDVYIKAYYGGSSGCTTFRAAGKRYGILNAVAESSDSIEQGDSQGTACFIDPETGNKSCG